MQGIDLTQMCKKKKSIILENRSTAGAISTESSSRIDDSVNKLSESTVNRISSKLDDSTYPMQLNENKTNALVDELDTNRATDLSISRKRSYVHHSIDQSRVSNSLPDFNVNSLTQFNANSLTDLNRLNSQSFNSINQNIPCNLNVNTTRSLPNLTIPFHREADHSQLTNPIVSTPIQRNSVIDLLGGPPNYEPVYSEHPAKLSNAFNTLNTLNSSAGSVYSSSTSTSTENPMNLQTNHSTLTSFDQPRHEIDLTESFDEELYQSINLINYYRDCNKDLPRNSQSMIGDSSMVNSVISMNGRSMDSLTSWPDSQTRSISSNSDLLNHDDSSVENENIEANRIDKRPKLSYSSTIHDFSSMYSPQSVNSIDRMSIDTQFNDEKFAVHKMESKRERNRQGRFYLVDLD